MAQQTLPETRMVGGLRWTRHAQIRLSDRMGITPEQAMKAVSPLALAMAAAMGATHLRVPGSSARLVLGDGSRSVVTVLT